MACRYYCTFWPNCATVRIKLQLCLNFPKCISDVIYLGICDLEYYNCIAVLSICSKSKMEWPQSPLTFLGCMWFLYPECSFMYSWGQSPREYITSEMHFAKFKVTDTQIDDIWNAFCKIQGHRYPNKWHLKCILQNSNKVAPWLWQWHNLAKIQKSSFQYDSWWPHREWALVANLSTIILL